MTKRWDVLQAIGRSPAAARACAAVTAFLLVLAAAPPLAARQHWIEQPTRGGHITALGINAALGGFTAGVRHHVHGGSFWTGFVGGAAGGAVIYAGKRLSAADFDGAGLAGRQLAAVGASLVVNASTARAPLDQLVLPLGPVQLVMHTRGGELPVLLRLDVPGAVALAQHALRRDTRFDLSASLSAGAPVFYTTHLPSDGWRGRNTAGVIMLRDPALPAGLTPVTHEAAFAHERIHVIQHDQLLRIFGAPLERALLSGLPASEVVLRHADLGLIFVPLTALNLLLPYHERPWEQEADFFAGIRYAPVRYAESGRILSGDR